MSNVDPKVAAFFREFSFLDRFVHPGLVTHVCVKSVDRECFEQYTTGVSEYGYTDLILLDDYGLEITRVSQGEVRYGQLIWWNPLTWFSPLNSQTVAHALERCPKADRVYMVLMIRRFSGPLPGVFNRILGLWEHSAQVTLYRSKRTPLSEIQKGLGIEVCEPRSL